MLSLGIKEYDEVKTVLIMMTSDVEIIVMLDIDKSAKGNKV